MAQLGNSFKVINRYEQHKPNLDTPQWQALFSDMHAPLLLEPTSLEEVAHTVLHDYLVKSDDFILAAIATKRNRLERTMRAFIKNLNTALTGTEITAGANTVSSIGDVKGRIVGDAIISKPRKAGVIAVMTAQIPLSDGQSVYIVFHAPDDDPMQIGEKDTLIAFQFRLNKRDITHLVAPNNGRDISLKQTTMALANAIEKNSQKFQDNQTKAKEEKAALERQQEALDAVIVSTDNAIEQMEAAQNKRLETIVKIDGVDAEIRGQKALNDALRKRIDQLNQEAKDKAEQARLDNILNVKTMTEQQALDFVDSLELRDMSTLVERLREMQYTALETLTIRNLYQKAIAQGLTPSMPTVEEYLQSTDEDESLEEDYSPRVNLKRAQAIADELGIKHTSEIDKDVEDTYNVCLRVNLQKGDIRAFLQILADGKSAIFDSNGVRLARFGQHSFFPNYSNDHDTLRDRLTALSSAVDDMEAEQANAQTLATKKEEITAQVGEVASAMIQAFEGRTVGERPPMTKEFSAQLGAIVNAHDEALHDELNLRPVNYSQVSKFLDTALVELQNGGYIPAQMSFSVNDEVQEDELQENAPVTDSDTVPEAEPEQEPVPEVPTELLAIQRDIDQLETQRDNMKLANKATQKYNRNVGKNPDKALETLKAEFKAITGYSEALAERVANTPNYMGKIVAHESWELTNLGQRIKSRQAKLKEMESRIADAQAGDEEFDLTIDGFSVTVSTDYDDDRIRIAFNDLAARPTVNDAEYPYVNKIRKSFNWSRANGAWQRKITNNARRDTAWAFGFDNWDALKREAMSEPQAKEETVPEQNPITQLIDALKQSISDQTDIDALIRETEEAHEQLSKANLLDEYEPVLNEASDRITELLEQF